MNIQARKLSLIEYLVSLKDENLFEKIEESVLELKGSKLSIFTEEELILRAEEANLDYNKGNYSTQEDLEKESKNW
ncbi:hypothetical protein MPF19_05125 [Polaribacter sp. Z014]|uniref:hypothetical protein n=1 Tax=unclassified Polaribacter TaxID=196858 RepID=UPI00193C0901|nr:MULTISPECIES: hypothetical protein [unclassified Polaribacter]MCL7762789.1 hypothetical protein [Polaribacter sp. Z014]QVY66282.1 hypothetical protein JOP69_03005 [Polaribacter sp. Q13]